MIVTPQTRRCKRGHLLTDDSVYFYKKPSGRLGRHCKACRRVRLGQQPRLVRTILQRIFDRISFEENGCWIWTGTCSVGGYGAIGFSGGRVTRPVHRVLYELVVGPVAKGLELDHLCRNRACANLDHLEAVTHWENCRRARAAAQIEVAA